MSNQQTKEPSAKEIKSGLPAVFPDEVLVKEYIKAISEQNFAAISPEVLETHLRYLPGVKIETNPSQIREGSTILTAGQYSLTLRDIFEKQQTFSKVFNTKKYQVEYFDESVVTISGMPSRTKNIYMLNDETKLVGRVKNEIFHTEVSLYDKDNTLLYKIEDTSPCQKRWRWLTSCSPINYISKCIKEHIIYRKRREGGSLNLIDMKTKKIYALGIWERVVCDNTSSGNKISIKTFDINFPNFLSPKEKLLVVAGLIAESQLSGRLIA